MARAKKLRTVDDLRKYLSGLDGKLKLQCGDELGCMAHSGKFVICGAKTVEHAVLVLGEVEDAE
jgi:hypothetical protein